MPLVQVQVIKDVFNEAQKHEIIEKITDVMVSIEGEALRCVTWVNVVEVDSGSWGIGGQVLTTEAVRTMQGAG
jgi:4-oxalocrotonate tautomerase